MFSIVVPCYNEEKRINDFLPRLVAMFPKDEIILVDDGSSDKTLNLLRAMTKNRKNVKILTYKKNQGKGYAIRTGILAAGGDFVLFIDADGSIQPDEIKKMKNCAGKYDVVVGTRASQESVVKQPRKRKILGMTFNLLVNIFFQTGIKDSLCGFKGFRKAVAQKLFKDLKSTRWIFDVELFYKIKKEKYTLYQLPIRWEHRGASKIKPLDPLRMFLQIISLRIKLLFG